MLLPDPVSFSSLFRAFELISVFSLRPLVFSPLIIVIHIRCFFGKGHVFQRGISWAGRAFCPFAEKSIKWKRLPVYMYYNWNDCKKHIESFFLDKNVLLWHPAHNPTVCASNHSVALCLSVWKRFQWLFSPWLLPWWDLNPQLWDPGAPRPPYLTYQSQ